MKAYFRYLTRAGFIGLFVIFACLGCNGVGQKFNKWQTSVTESVKGTLNFNGSSSGWRGKSIC